MKTYVEQTWGWDEAAATQRTRERVARGGFEIIVLGGVAIGTLNCVRREDSFFLGSIEVLPEYQREGCWN